INLRPQEFVALESFIIKALKDPERNRKTVKKIKHKDDDVTEVARIMRPMRI
ncbi:unnamed protein product, partial [Arabidopsis halleri]